jgi:Ca2+:H+ antiporter
VQAGGPAQPTQEADARWPTAVVVGVLAGSSAAAAFVSNWFVDSLTPAINTLHISEAFVGFVIVAIAGNAAENFAGVRLAAQNRADYAVSLILQSPVQIALGLVPVLVLLSNVLGGATLTLVLPVLLVVALAIATIVVVVVVFDGESTWLEGVTLVGLYATIAAAFWWG